MKNPRARIHSPSAVAGFTLVEIVIVIALIGLILALVANRIMGSQKQAEYRLAKTQLNTLSQKVESYQADVGNLPDTLDQLVTAPNNAPGWLGPYARATEFKDPWQTQIEYRHPGNDNQPYQLISLGADRKAGGEGVDKDLTAP